MLCSFCLLDSKQIEWDLSHLGKRPICFACIGLRDIERMRRYKSIILYMQDNSLVNLTKTLKFKIKYQYSFQKDTYFVFLFEKRRWIGIKYNGVERVNCRKLNDLFIG